MMDACILLISVLAMTYSSDEPKTMDVFKCGSHFVYMIEKEEVAYIDKLNDSEIYIYQEIK